jgi:hypothetical protein
MRISSPRRQPKHSRPTLVHKNYNRPRDCDRGNGEWFAALFIGYGEVQTAFSKLFQGEATIHHDVGAHHERGFVR